MIDIPSTGVQSLRPHAFQNAATARITRLRGVFSGSGVSSLATLGSPGYLHEMEEQQQGHTFISLSLILVEPEKPYKCFAGHTGVYVERNILH